MNKKPFVITLSITKFMWASFSSITSTKLTNNPMDNHLFIKLFLAVLVWRGQIKILLLNCCSVIFINENSFDQFSTIVWFISAVNWICGFWFYLLCVVRAISMMCYLLFHRMRIQNAGKVCVCVFVRTGKRAIVYNLNDCPPPNNVQMNRVSK